MNKMEYMQALGKSLRRLPKEEFEKAIAYFEEYFADAGIENETQVIRDLGTPEFAAKQIITNIALKNTKEPAADMKKGLHNVWVGILALCAAPIALPLALAFVIVIAALIFSILLFLACFILMGAILVLGSPICIIAAFMMLPFNVPAFITCIGMGLLSAGLGTLLSYGMIKLSCRILTGTTRFFGHLISKRRKING